MEIGTVFCHRGIFVNNEQFEKTKRERIEHNKKLGLKILAVLHSDLPIEAKIYESYELAKSISGFYQAPPFDIWCDLVKRVKNPTIESLTKEYTMSHTMALAGVPDKAFYKNGNSLAISGFLGQIDPAFDEDKAIESIPTKEKAKLKLGLLKSLKI